VERFGIVLAAQCFLALSISTCLCAQCDDVEISTKVAKRGSDLVFQGTIQEFRGSGADRNVVFRVSRVWKGRVGPTFEMPAIQTGGSLCTAFWNGLLAPGNELVVFASRSPFFDQKYLALRQKSVLVSESKDISKLGRWHKPK
jgi:hypothetical protein